ncbi:MAG TPA: hypothetical protein VFI59_01475 [Actinomycetota bacterium]|nr:hypothetical protein [Actinomycetota bacterium]
MGCLIVLMALIGPRVALVFTWIFTNLVDRAFEDWVVPALGLIFLPWTTFLYVLVYNPVEGVSFLGWLIVVLGLLADLGSYTYGAKSRR